MSLEPIISNDLTRLRAEVKSDLGLLRMEVAQLAEQVSNKSVIKSVQRGTVDLATAGSSQFDINISAVVLAKSVVNTNYSIGSSSVWIRDFSLINSTTVRCKGSFPVSVSPCIVTWEVLEYF